MPDLAIIVTKLADAKAAEERAKATRLRIEEELAAAIGVPESWTGSTTSDICGYKVTCARRDNVKIDADAVRGIASRHSARRSRARPERLVSRLKLKTKNRRSYYGNSRCGFYL